MTWFGSPLFLAALAVLAVVALILDQWLLRTGRTEVIVTAHHRHVAHRKLRATAEAWIGGAAGTTSSPASSLNPAPGLPGTLPPGAGLSSGNVGCAGPRTAEDHRFPEGRHRPTSVGGPQQPAAVDETPDLTAAGPQPHPRGEEVAGAVRPRPLAPATQPQDAGAVAQPAPARCPT